MKKIFSKGQVSSYDVLIALIIFLLMFVVLRQLPMSNLAVAIDDFTYSEMRIYSGQAFDSILKTNGYPIDWDVNNVEIIGLAQRANIIDEEKVIQFLQLDYNNAKEALALNKYDFNLSINSVEDSKEFSFGVNVPSDKEIIVIERVIYYGGEANAILKVFK